ncbi:hsp70 family protein [Gigaspora margarita]|uniref:Hsp70 family protein n=1 Tax=Gigaspora margarita TaxID=4874 RepID=A0A8H3XBG2_GIGMA|nr:hsp70 family protein [Gigaspora margarita]
MGLTHSNEENNDGKRQILNRLSEKCDRGFKFDKDIVRKASKISFKFSTTLDEDIINLLNSQYDIDNECIHEFDVFCNKNFILTEKLKADLPWLSIFLGISHEKIKKKLQKFKISTIYTHEKWEKAEIILDSCIEPTTEFIEDVKSALKKNTNLDKIEALRKITKDYGSFYAERLVFGKAKFKEKINSNTTNEVSRTYNTELQLEVLTAQNNFSNIINNEEHEVFNYSYSKSGSTGGDDYTQWEIIEYSDIHLIFDLLDFDDSCKNLREQILDILGYRILRAGVEHLRFNLAESKPLVFPLGNELAKIDLSKCHIYASIMNENIKQMFSIRIDYVAEDTVEFIIDLIKLKKEKNDKLTKIFSKSKLTKIFSKSFKNSYPFKLCWIVVGKPGVFDFDMKVSKYPVTLRSYKYTYNDFYKESRSMLSKVIEIPKHLRTCMLSTCVLESSPEIDRFNMPIIVGTHFSPSNCSVRLFAYSSDGGSFNDDNVFGKFSLHFCAVDLDMTNDIKFGQAYVKWNRNEANRYISYGAFENPCLNQILSRKENNENFILVNLLTNCSKHQGLINVTQNEIIYGSFNSCCMNRINCKDCNEGKMAYLEIPL